jgi:hypothetical protein
VPAREDRLARRLVFELWLDDVNLEACRIQPAQPGLLREQPADVAVLLDADLLPLADQIREIDEVARRVRRVGANPLDIAQAESWPPWSVRGANVSRT